MRYLLFFCIFSITSWGQLKRVAVIDTGLPINSRAKICDGGHQDFTNTTVFDIHGHSSHVSDLIYQNVGTKTNYCLYFLKYWSPEESGRLALDRSNAALRYILAQEKTSMIVYAGGGYYLDSTERSLIQQVLNKGITIVAAAGNSGYDLDVFPLKFYPAAYDSRIIVVGATNRYGHRLNLSNYGKSVDAYQLGESVEALVNGETVRMTGTSQATGIHAGKVLKSWAK